MTTARNSSSKFEWWAYRDGDNTDTAHIISFEKSGEMVLMVPFAEDDPGDFEMSKHLARAAAVAPEALALLERIQGLFVIGSPLDKEIRALLRKAERGATS